MKVAVINEISSCNKNADIINALSKLSDIEIYNVGMTFPEEKPELTYIQTGIMSAILLNINACDIVIGGCGTGQGYLNAVMQFPNVFCGLVSEPLDAWLFSQINGGNCVSLALNKGYGWAGNINLNYIFEKLFLDKPGNGYPTERQESQKQSRIILKEISTITHLSFVEILKNMDKKYLKPIKNAKRFISVVMKCANTNDIAKEVKNILSD